MLDEYDYGVPDSDGVAVDRPGTSAELVWMWPGGTLYAGDVRMLAGHVQKWIDAGTPVPGILTVIAYHRAAVSEPDGLREALVRLTHEPYYNGRNHTGWQLAVVNRQSGQLIASAIFGMDREN